KAGQVATRVGLAESLAPDLVGREQRLQIALLLRFGPVRDHDRAAHAEPDDVDGLGSVGLDHLVVEDQLLHEARAASAVLLGPGDANVAGLMKLSLPGPAALDESLLALGHGASLFRLVGLQPGSDLIPEGLLGGAQLEVHCAV